VQEALALEILFCAPLRIKNLVALNLGVHFFRAIVTKLYTDLDPGGGPEVMRLTMGHTSYAMFRKHYMQRKNRASQQRYLEALEGCLLGAFGRVRIDSARSPGG
jgi:hypothetical protein